MSFRKLLVQAATGAAIFLSSIGSVAWAVATIPATATTTYTYQTAANGYTPGVGATNDAACYDYYYKNNGFGSLTPPPQFTAVPSPGLCEIIYTFNSNTWLYSYVYAIGTESHSCKPGETLDGTQCLCPAGQDRSDDGLACVPERPIVNEPSNSAPAPESESGSQTCTPTTRDGAPILSATGEKILDEVDFEDSFPHPLNFVRTYKSQRKLGPLTNHPWSNIDTRWTHNYSVHLADAPVGKRVLFSNGTVKSFVQSTTTLAWASTNSIDQLSFNATTSQWTYIDKSSDTEWIFNADGKPLTATTHGRVLTFTYSTTASYTAPGPGYLVTVTNHFGRSINFRYNPNGTIVNVYLPNGINWTYYYENGTNNLQTLEYYGGGYKNYAYEVSGKPWLLTGKSTANGRLTTYTYDSQERATTTQLAGGVDMYSVSYPLTGTDRTVTDPLGTQRTSSYGTNGGTLARTAFNLPADKSGEIAASRVQDANGLITSETDFNGVVTSTNWDTARHLPLTVTRAVGLAEQQVTQFSWHPTLTLPSGITESGRATAYTYDADGNKLSETVKDLTTNVTRTSLWTYSHTLPVTLTDPKGGVWQFGYDSLGRTTSIKNPLNHETTYTYNSDSLLQTETAANGLVTTYAYDRARLASITRADEVTNFTFDGDLRLTYAKLPNNYRLYYYYDAASRLTSIADNHGNVVTYTLDAAGNRVGETVQDSGSNIVLSITRVINALNRVYQVKDAANNATTLAYNSNGDLTGQTEPLSRTTSQTLDGLRRPTANTFADSSTTSQSWNARNELTSATDPKGVQTTYTRNAFGEVTSETSADIGTVNYVRDALGAVTQRTDAKGNITTITRDALGRPTTIQYGPSNIVTYTWDSAPSGTPNQKGFLSKIEDPSGSTTYVRDIFGRVTKKTQVVNDNSTSPTTLVYDFQYYQGGQLFYVKYPSGLQIQYYPTDNGKLDHLDYATTGSWISLATSPVFTPLGALKSLNFGSGDSLQRSFNADGRMTGNEFANYGYDAGGRLTSITQSLASSTATSSVFGTSLSWTIGYDSRDRVTSFNRAGAGSSYTYDANSNRLTSSESYSSDSDLDGNFTGNDATSTNAKSLSFGFTSNKLLGFTQVVTSTSAGSTTSVVTTPISYSLDANGAMTSDGLRTYEYDESNRLNKVRILHNGEAAAVTYLTNGLGQRVFKSEPKADQYLPDEEELGVDFIAWLKSKFRWMFESAQASASVGTSFAYGEGDIPSWALLGEYDNGSASGTGRTEYVWLPLKDGTAVPIGMWRNNRMYTIHPDHLGTPRLVKDDTNTPVWQLPYSAFGNNRPVGVLSTTTTTGYAITPGTTPLKATQPAARLNLRFPGQYADSETGEFYNYFRNYDPKTGRYTEPDPIGLGGGRNRFSYVESGSFGHTDPEGLQTRGNVTPGGPGSNFRWPRLGPEPREVVGPYSTTTQSETVNGMNASRGRMGTYSGNLLDYFARNTNGPINTLTTRDGNLRFETTLPNGTRMQYRTGEKGPRVDIFPPGGVGETLHSPGPIGGMWLR